MLIRSMMHTDCEICRLLRSPTAGLAKVHIKFPASNPLLRAPRMYSLDMCETHLKAFGAALGLEDVSVDTFDSTMFSSPDVRQSIFGNDETYRVFMYYFLGNSSRVRYAMNDYPAALNHADWERKLKVTLTSNWTNLRFYELGDQVHSIEHINYITQEHVDFYINFLDKFLHLSTLSTLRHKDESTKIYVSIAMQSRVTDRNVFRDYMYVGISDSPDCVRQLHRNIDSYGQGSPFGIIWILQGAAFDQEEFSESNALQLVRYIDNTPTSPSPYELEEVLQLGRKVHQSHVRLFFASIGLRQWNSDAQLFEYM